MIQEKIAVIVPVRGQGEHIIRCVRSLLQVNYHLLEIIVVDDGLDEKSLAALAMFKDNIRILKSEGHGPSFARNLAAMSTDAAYVAFTDSDCLVPRDWIAELLRGFEQVPGVVACGGSQVLPEEAVDFEINVFFFMKKVGFIADYTRKFKGSSIIKVNHNPSCNVMYKRDVFVSEGGFLEGLWPAEDVEFDYRLKRNGYTLVCSPSAVVYHHRPPDLKSFSRMMYRYGLTQGQLVRKHGFFRKIHFIPFLSLLILGSSVFLIMLSFLYFTLTAILGIISVLLYFKFDFRVILIAAVAFLSWHGGFFKGLAGWKK